MKCGSSPGQTFETTLKICELHTIAFKWDYYNGECPKCMAEKYWWYTWD